MFEHFSVGFSSCQTFLKSMCKNLIISPPPALRVSGDIVSAPGA